MADSIGQAYVQILPTTKGFSSKLSSELGGGGGLAAAGKSMGRKIIAGLSAAGIGAAVTKGIKSAISEGGELQQNLGGTEAVFGKFAKTLQDTAGTAYKNMGMSASDYMATANKMGSLFQGSGIKQEKALSMTTDAMQRAADVASVMGIDTQMAMESIAGAAKGNFTMMDNLGVAMNATTLKAYALEKGVNFDWNTATNAEKAELAMEMFMDRTSQYQGNFAKESEQTLTGSIGAMKALTQDLLGNLAIGADITPQISALLDTASAFLIQNLIPMISNVVTGVANNAGQLAGVLSQLVFKIGDEIIKTAPTLLQAGITLIVELGKALATGLPIIMPMIVKLVTDLALMLTSPDNLNNMVMVALDLVVALADGLGEATPVLISAIPDIIMNLINALLKILPQLVPVAIKIVASLATGLVSQAGAIAKAAIKLIEELKNKFKNTDWKKVAKDAIDGIIKGWNEGKARLIAKIKEIADLLPDAVKKALKIGSPSKVMADIAKWIPIGMAVGITKNAHFVDDAINDMVGGYNVLSSRGMSMNISTRDNTAAYSYAGIYNAVKQGASDSQPIIILNNRVMSRELKGMGVQFA